MFTAAWANMLAAWLFPNRFMTLGLSNAIGLVPREQRVMERPKPANTPALTLPRPAARIPSNLVAQGLLFRLELSHSLSGAFH